MTGKIRGRHKRTGHYSLLALRSLQALILAALIGGEAVAAGERVQRGGTLEVGTMFVTLSALSWDPYDFNWKLNHDTGQIYEQLIVGDLEKATSRGGPHRFVADSYLPSDAMRGELAERWEFVEQPLSVVFTLRKGVRFTAKPGVMAARELTAEDVVFAFNRARSSPKVVAGYYDFVDRAEARDPHTVVFHFKEYNAEWDYRLAWGFYSAIVPKEVVDAGATNWRNVNGTGPFQLSDFVQGNQATYTANPDYWGRARIGGSDERLPLIDKIVYRTIRDEATQHTALRTAKIDMLEVMSWQAHDELKKSAPQLKFSRHLLVRGPVIALRNDIKPFDDVRVRRALNIAVNKKELVEAANGNAELFAYPMYPDWQGYYEPLERMPASVRELYQYDPKKARALLAEAGYPNGFTFKLQYCSCSPAHGDTVPLLAAYYEQIGVKIEAQPMEYAPFLSAMTSKKHAAGYLFSSGHTNPTTNMRKTFVTGQTWNAAMYSDAKFDAKMEEVYRTRDEAIRQRLLKERTVEILDAAPYVWLPVPYVYAGWWPWVKNYAGEMNVGSVRPGPIYAQIWIDQELKRKMGY